MEAWTTGRLDLLVLPHGMETPNRVVTAWWWLGRIRSSELARVGPGARTLLFAGLSMETWLDSNWTHILRRLTAMRCC